MAQQDPPRVELRDYANPIFNSKRTGLVPPTITNAFELKPALVNMVSNNQFSGHPSEDPHLHLKTFIELCETFKMNGMTEDAIRLRLFPFSLRDKAKLWLYSLDATNINTWDGLTKAFLNKYFPPSKTVQLRNQITCFLQKEHENLHEAWERYKELIRACPHHGLEQWLIVQTFYNGLIPSTKIIVDAAAGGSFENKTMEESYTLIEKLAQNHAQWSIDRTPRAGGKHDVDTITMLTAKMEAMQRKIDSLSNQPSGKAIITCNFCGIVGHSALECTQGMASTDLDGSEQVNAVWNNNQRRDPYSNTYNPGWRDHPNFSYRNQNVENPASNQGGQQPYQNRSNQPASYLSKLEALVESYIAEQKETNKQFHSTLQGLTQRIDTLNAQGKILENQVIQMAKPQPPPQPKPQPPPQQPKEAPPNNQLGMPPNFCNAVFVRDGVGVEEEVYVAPPPYVPPIPFPQRLYGSEVLRAYNSLRTLEIVRPEVPRPQAISHMVEYSKSMDAIPIVAEEFKHPDKGPEEVSIMEKRENPRNTDPPPKMADQGTFSIPCVVNWKHLDDVMCDLGGSVNLMSRKTFESTGLSKLEPSEKVLQFANGTSQKSAGLAVDVPVWVGNYKILADFQILDMKVDDVPILLGRPFLATVRANFDVWNAKLTFLIGDDEVIFDMKKPRTNEFLENKCRNEESEEEISDEDFSEWNEIPHNFAWVIWDESRTSPMGTMEVVNVDGWNYGSGWNSDPEETEPPDVA